MLQQQQPLADLANTYRELYRARFQADVQAGTATPFILPLHLFAYWIIPTLYLAIPHRNKPWLYGARWLVLAFICAFHWHMIRDVRSLNFASSYCAGILAAWATVWNFTLLVWTRPQWDAKRVERRRKIRGVDWVGNSYGSNRPHASSQPEFDASSGQASVSLGVNKNTLDADLSIAAVGVRTTHVRTTGFEKALNDARKRELHAEQYAALLDSIDTDMEEKLLVREIVALSDRNGGSPFDMKTALELCSLAREQEWEYYWQEFPANASFWTRLDWAFDMVSSFRLTGWNWAPSCLPPYEPPPRIGPYQLPLEYGLHRSKQGYERTLSRQRFVISRWFFNIVPSYIIIDLCATLMTTDPYFVVGPEHHHPLPTQLASLHPVLLSLLRTILAFAGVLSALQLLWNCGAVFLALYCPPILGFRAHPWHLPSMSGSFMQVMDRGMAGFWGAWWHQTFRAGFSAPTKWLFRHRYLPPSHKNGDGGGSKLAILGPLIGAILAFAQSGMLHGAGSFSSVPKTYYWGPPLFFALAGLGTMLQLALSHLLRHRIKKLPCSIRRLGNLTFVFLWLWATSWVLVDDFGRCGIWLWEPVPVSLARAAGLGGDRRIWRYDRDFLPRWHWGAQGRWWETGIAV